MLLIRSIPARHRILFVPRDYRKTARVLPYNTITFVDAARKYAQNVIKSLGARNRSRDF